MMPIAAVADDSNALPTIGGKHILGAGFFSVRAY
jgi:hypothetical protein